jgi:hypothetical protein
VVAEDEVVTFKRFFKEAIDAFNVCSLFRAFPSGVRGFEVVTLEAAEVGTLFTFCGGTSFG